MRIVSKHHDYYDSVMSHGQDLGTVYVRKIEPVPGSILEKLENFQDSLYGRNRSYNSWRESPLEQISLDGEVYSKLNFHTSCLFFCGKAYRFCVVRLDPRVVYLGSAPTIKEYFYNLDDLAEFLQTHGKLVQDIYRRKFSDAGKNVTKLAAFLSSQGTDELEEDLVKARIVTARFSRVPDTVHDYAWQCNLPLKDVKFFKVKDPYTTFQELDMYISGVLGQQEKETINISDKDRIVQHGYDQYSFRKPPQPKGRKKQNPS